MLTVMVCVSVLIMIAIPGSVLFSGFKKVNASFDLGSIDEITRNFTEDLNSEIEKIVSEAVNDTSALDSSSAILSSESNLSSSQTVISNNQSISTGFGQGSLILNQIKNENGICTSTKIGGSGNDTLSSQGVCNDQLTGGQGADKFVCGAGTDTVRDYSPEEGDSIVDRENCETVL
jgi:hypothetical protein